MNNVKDCVTRELPMAGSARPDMMYRVARLKATRVGLCNGIADSLRHQQLDYTVRPSAANCPAA